MMQHMSGGQWGLVARRVCEAASRNLPFVALMFVPVLLGMPRLYEWARPGAAATDHMIQMKAPYLNVPFFIGRAVLFFAVWAAGSWLLNAWSAGAGSRRGGRASQRHRALPHHQRAGAADLRRHDDVRVGRLDHVARPALVLDDFRVHSRRRSGAREPSRWSLPCSPRSATSSRWRRI